MLLPLRRERALYCSNMTATDPLLSSLGARVRRLRADRGLTSREVAERSGLSLRFYGQLENGSANIAFTRLAAVAHALEVPLSRLVDDAADAGALASRPVVGLLGLRGAGKSTVGPLVARSLGVPFVELDESIEERAGLSLPEIFAMHGEAWYRRLAEGALKDLVHEGEPCVVALPGGIVQDEEAWRLVKERCATAWLRARPADHMDRVARPGDRRPMADRADAMGELRALLASREPAYRQADVVVDTSRRGAAESAAAVASGLHRLGWRAG
jgi:XRE family aerobic/anaerobic benzoate catabolism transcriptional regulator